MTLLNFDDLFAQADKLRNDGRVDEAIAAYNDIATLAGEDDRALEQAKAWHLAAASAKEAIEPGGNEYFQKALQYSERAATAFTAQADWVSLGAVYRDWAVTYDYAALYNQALPYFQKSIEVLQKAESWAQLGVTYDKLGLHYLLQGQFDQAASFINQALSSFKQLADIGFPRATALFDLSRVYFATGELDQAEDLALQSLGWFEADHGTDTHNRRKAQLYGLLTLIYYRLNNQKSAAKYSRLYQEFLAKLAPVAAKVVNEELNKLSQ